MSVAAKTFQRIYENNLWGFGSGHGSLPRVTKSYRLFIENSIREKQISSAVDFGCGDWQFSRFIDWSAVVHSFSGAPVISFRKCRIYPSWRKNVLLFSNLPTGRRQ